MQKAVLLALLLGIISGFFPFPGQEQFAEGLIQLFMNALKLVSLPVIFLSLLVSLIGFKEKGEIKWMGKNVLRYTLATTLIAAAVALGLFLAVAPVGEHPELQMANPQIEGGGYLSYLLNIVPINVFQPFVEGNVIAVLFLAVALGLALLTTPGKEKIHAVLRPVLDGLMKITRAICWVIPLSVWAGVVLSFGEFKSGGLFASLSLYLIVIVGANLLQGFVILPIFLKWKGYSPIAVFRQFLPALSVAFFSKSSVASIPVAMRCAEENLGVSPRISKFAFPICTTINMNGCAAFILTTVLYVSMSHGLTFSPFELAGWVLIATLAAVGNAGVPMGCYFLSSALLASMNVPLEMMALILPFYSVIDMVETALNVFSDGCVTLMVQKKAEVEKPQLISQEREPSALGS
jgi:Na+/H+-dicarboxylate symporter